MGCPAEVEATEAKASFEFWLMEKTAATVTGRLWTLNNRAVLAFICFKYANTAQAYRDEGERNRKQKASQFHSWRNWLTERTYSGSIYPVAAQTQQDWRKTATRIDVNWANSHKLRRALEQPNYKAEEPQLSRRNNQTWFLTNCDSIPYLGLIYGQTLQSWIHPGSTYFPRLNSKEAMYSNGKALRKCR